MATAAVVWLIGCAAHTHGPQSEKEPGPVYDTAEQIQTMPACRAVVVERGPVTSTSGRQTETGFSLAALLPAPTWCSSWKCCRRDGPTSFLTRFRNTKSNAGEQRIDMRRALANCNEAPNHPHKASAASGLDIKHAR